MASSSDIDTLLERLFPICRSITGNGVRETLSILKEYIPLEIHEIQSGTQAFDWIVPKEWNITDAYILKPNGEKIADFKKNNLHIVGYSIPTHTKVSFAELKKHLHTMPEQPDVIPYRTSYYKEAWGFCLSHNEFIKLPEGEYEVIIDATFADGSLTYGELFLPGKTEDEVLLSAYTCHPSMANDNVSGIATLTFLAQEMARTNHRYSYRFVFAPETIGALVWLSKNQENATRIKHGLIATCAGDNGPFTYKKSRQGNTEIDRIVAKVLADSGAPHNIIDFFPMGSDERQYCSPGFNLPIGSLMRTMYHLFPQYHTSADNLSFVKGAHIAETIVMYKKVIETLEQSRIYQRTNPYGEPQLGKRDLYSNLGGPVITDIKKQAMLWILNYSDGEHSLQTIADRSTISLDIVSEVADTLLAEGLIV